MDTPRANEVAVASDGQFLDILLPLISDSYTYDFPVTFALLEIDNFDTYAREHGLLTCEAVLAEFGPVLRRFFRASDLCERLEGNKFLVVLGGAPVEISPRIAENLRGKVESYRFLAPYIYENLRQITVSIGLATTLDTNLPPKRRDDPSAVDNEKMRLDNAWDIAARMLENAAQALANARENGKNQLAISPAYRVLAEPATTEAATTEAAAPESVA